ncbi:MAG: glycosyltransferase family 2 protein [Candidatus Amesbacteria bacterium]|nr:glycosyltransferase family 2 protein [Candidatus Amesbacteria bacterium]
MKRFLEIIPGFISWNIIAFLFWGGYFFPDLTAYFILLFDVFWVYKGLSLLVATLVSHFRIQAATNLDWMKEVAGFGDWKKVRHIVVILVANEPKETVETTVEALSRQTFPTQQIGVVLAADSWSKTAKIYCDQIQKAYAKKFGSILVTLHPNNLPGEIKGKSSNEAWAARRAKEILIDKMGWDMRYTTITSNDADAILHRQYFAYLTFKFLDDPHRYLKFWQPAIVFYNNIWRIPMPSRVVNALSNIWQISILSRKDRLVNFSNYTASLQMIHDIGYWDTDVIPEDYRIFFKAFFALDGKVEVEPIFLPSSADAAESSSIWKTFYNDYQQKKRWAWGVSDLPLFIMMFISKPHISFVNKLLRIIRVIEDHILWPINWFMITAGVFIVTLVNPVFQRTSLGYALPKISSGLLSILLFALMILVFVELRQRPPRPKDQPRWKSWSAPFEFILMPVVAFFFGALPGLDAHTRLMLGKYIEYRVTEKIS